ncbi:MAG: PKD domain-containing protein [Crocinitomicaceae bacterium]|nr:PKD domain-containing protein [Crocinitomicaceae bacterium]
MRKALGLTLILATVLFSCNKPPEACIELDSNSVSAGTPITFSAECSKRSLSYIWSFEGPTGAPENDSLRSEEVFSMAFSVTGSYTVKLEAYERYSWNGQMGETSTTFTVN